MLSVVWFVKCVHLFESCIKIEGFDSKNQCLRPANSTGLYLCLHVGYYVTWHCESECALLKFSSKLALCDSIPDKCLCESCIARFWLNLYIPLKMQRL